VVAFPVSRSWVAAFRVVAILCRCYTAY
jgi:hypothetical protein